MNLCSCDTPTRRIGDGHVDRLRCALCAGYTPYGPELDLVELKRRVRFAIARILNVAEEYRWACEYVPRRGPCVPVSRVESGDPTGNQAVSPQAAQIASWRLVAARAIDQLLDHADVADAALGEARYVADPGPADHVKAAWHDTVPANRPDLADAYAARARRRERGEL
ncbi:MAG: hypothetical protein LC798_19650 [Chloroflexi bacterium]|nr:hypothetical protein [Chloroflexota bacterium]